MRITAINAEQVLPIKSLSADELSDLVVIAGPNGVGKTRLITELLNSFRGANRSIRLAIEPTNAEERAVFNDGTSIDDADWLQKIAPILHQNRRRRDFHSSVLYYESSRAIQNVSPLQFQWEFADPWEEILGWDIPLQGLGGRWTDTQHAIFKRIQSQRSSIATRAVQLKQAGHTTMNLQFEDPLDIFRDVFARLLGPKTLKRVDLQGQQIYYEFEGSEFPISALSSGEREVVTICFDFLLRKPSDCIVFFDEPEVHLHPELLSRMVTALRSAGDRNQFIFSTHSPELISSSLSDTVLFITPPKEDGSNQAINLSKTQGAPEVLNALGQSVGILSLGKKIVFIEGEEASLDKKTYQQILDNGFPSLVLVAAGGRGQIENFDDAVRNFLSKSLWGIDFYMLTDRDVADEATGNGGSNLARLSRYHLENYFLDESIISAAFEGLEEAGHWSRDESEIARVLREIAAGFVSYKAALVVSHKVRALAGNVSIMPSGCNGLSKDELVAAFIAKAEAETIRVSGALDSSSIQNVVVEEYERAAAQVSNASEEWKSEFPGKPILRTFCARLAMTTGRFQTLYIHQSRKSGFANFSEINEIFARFAA